MKSYASYYLLSVFKFIFQNFFNQKFYFFKSKEINKLKINNIDKPEIVYKIKSKANEQIKYCQFIFFLLEFRLIFTISL